MRYFVPLYENRQSSSSVRRVSYVGCRHEVTQRRTFFLFPKYTMTISAVIMVAEDGSENASPDGPPRGAAYRPPSRVPHTWMDAAMQIPFHVAEDQAEGQNARARPGKSQRRAAHPTCRHACLISVRKFGNVACARECHCGSFQSRGLTNGATPSVLNPLCADHINQFSSLLSVARWCGTESRPAISSSNRRGATALHGVLRQQLGSVQPSALLAAQPS